MSSFLPPTNYNFELQGAAYEGSGLTGIPITYQRDPTTLDLSSPSGAFRVGQHWWSTSSSQLFILQSVVGGQAFWVSVGTPGGGIFTLQGLLPILGNFNFVNLGGITIAAIPGQISLGANVDGVVAKIIANQITVQTASASPVSNANLRGVASFNSAQFTVDGNGFVSALNGLASSSFPVQAFTAPGTNPVLPSALGALTINGATVAAQGIPVRSDSLAANTLQIEVQRAAATAATDATSQGLASFNSANFTVDANGFVTIIAGAGAVNITPNTGVNVITGTFSLLGTAVNQNGFPVRTNGTAINSMQIEVQRAAATVATNATSQGVASFNSANFTVDANGFVTAIAGAGSINITPNTGVNVTNSAFSLLASAVAASGVPIQSNGTAANSMTIQLQRASAQLVSSAANAGISSFFNGQFTVDANGFVTLINGLPASSFTVDAFTAPGTNPVIPSALGVVTVHGTSVAAHAIPVQTDSIAANSYQIEVQRASAQGASSAVNAGLASFNNTEFTVDGNGFVSLIGGSLAVDSIGVQASTAPGTNPVLPTVAGLLTINGAAVAAAGIPVRSDSIAVNALQIEVQFASQQAASAAANAGLASFRNTNFSVDANGFVIPVAGPGFIDITPSIGVHVTNSAYLFGASLVVASGNPIQTNGVAANQVNIQVQAASAQAVSAAANAGLASFNSAQFTVDANGFVSSISGVAPWLDFAGGLLVNHTGYFATAAAAYTLPAGVANGDQIEIVDVVGGGVVLTAQGGDKIQIGNVASSVNGTATTTQLGDSIRATFRLATATWYATPGVEGNWTLA